MYFKPDTREIMFWNFKNVLVHDVQVTRSDIM